MQRKRIILAIIAVTLLLAAILAYYLAHRSSPLTYSGTIETREINIGSKIGGRVTSVFVEEGQQVPANAPLVTFDAPELQAQRDQAAAAVLQAEADYNRLQHGNRPQEIAQADATLHENAALLQEALNGPRPEDIRQAQADFAAAKANAVDAASTYDRMKPLAEKDIISKQQFDATTAQRDNTAQLAESARQRLAVLQAGTRTEDIQAAHQRYKQALAADQLSHAGYRHQDVASGQGRLTQALARVAELDASLREAHLLSPSVATVETVSVRPGDLVPANQIVITLLEPSQLWVKVYVPETDLSHIHIGQSANVTVDSLNARHFTGHIQAINSAAEFLPRNVQTRDDREHEVFGVKVHIDNPNNVLKSGMSATVTLQ
ncbi:MAG TPA: efflux RND transporter periplasmic adaptor subunit [Acidobacteriaceae bacterium]|jgi:HlyD family secretion protein|nr:efflux RND transporter periplasmic adaptor subunit [Acidobacteriaceae bacterium]